MVKKSRTKQIDERRKAAIEAACNRGYVEMLYTTEDNDEQQKGIASLAYHYSFPESVYLDLLVEKTRSPDKKKNSAKPPSRFATAKVDIVLQVLRLAFYEGYWSGYKTACANDGQPPSPALISAVESVNDNTDSVEQFLNVTYAAFSARGRIEGNTFVRTEKLLKLVRENPNLSLLDIAVLTYEGRNADKRNPAFTKWMNHLRSILKYHNCLPEKTPRRATRRKK